MKMSLKILSLSLIFSLNAATDDPVVSEEAVSTQVTTNFSSVTQIDEVLENKQLINLSILFPNLGSSDEEITQMIYTEAHIKYADKNKDHPILITSKLNVYLKSLEENMEKASNYDDLISATRLLLIRNSKS